jgi:flagellar M-ring protein FliF
MNKILESIKRNFDKWMDLSSAKKNSSLLLLSALIFSIIFFWAYFNRVSYSTLFSNLEPSDAGRIVQKLDNENIKYKIEGKSVLVPKEKADYLRMVVLYDGFLPSTGKGFEIFNESKFGITDLEAKIMYQRALQGELERTIESFADVEKARVHLVLPERSVFAREENKATASVTLMLGGAKGLSQEQVRAIVALVSGSVSNLPRENIQVVDSNMNLLTYGLFDDDNPWGSIPTAKQHEYRDQFESNMQNQVKRMLESVFGPGKATVKLNADLDFDSRQVTTIKYDQDTVIRSQQKIKQIIRDVNGGGTGSGPVEDENIDSTREEDTTNYEASHTQETIIKAPGEVKRMTVSVLIDNKNLTDRERESIRNLVETAIGFSDDRGDKVSIEGFEFDRSLEEKAKAYIEAIIEQKKQENKRKLYTNIAKGVAAAFILFLLFLLLRKGKNNTKRQEERLLELAITKEIILPIQTQQYKHVIEDDEQDMTIDKEIKKYSSDKPEQAVEVVRRWLAEDER